ncbi:peptide chain release factor N(5)-glutamine methyltransferase [Patescibacteria group bacterium]|nr:MAG: peptide chain release factor N(5)-glutamine methyltransferase [Patescibacteria group bacterium]
MNENSQQPVLAIDDWLAQAADILKAAQINTARLDAEILLAHTLRKHRTYLHAHGEEPLDARLQEIADARIALRSDHVPVAYIIGHKEFYGRRFKVTTATLIPRPESETMIDVLKEVLPKNETLFNEKIRVVDVGTGSGVLGITAKLEWPELDVTLLDISVPALKVAETNSESLHAHVQTLRSDLLTGYPFTPDVVLANLPYVDETWERSLETNKEPRLALFAGNGGKALIYKLITQASTVLKPKGIIILEADPSQHQDITHFAQDHGFRLLHQDAYCIALEHI